MGGLSFCILCTSMAIIMKVLWITNSVAFPDLCREMGMSEPQLGGWMKSLLFSLQSNFPELEFGIAVPFGGMKYLKKTINGISYYCMPFEATTTYRKELEPIWKQVHDDFLPDVVHIHGTEYVHGLVYVKACGADNVVISLQGLISGIAPYYYGGISDAVLKRNSGLIEYISNSIKMQKKSLQIRSNLEHEYFLSCNHIVGRTEWDRTHIWSINPNAYYHVCNENLRPSFYDGIQWSPDSCQAHRIFVSQSSSPLKGLHKVLEAMPLVLRQYPDAEVYIAGKDFAKHDTLFQKLKARPFSNYIHSLIYDNGLEKRVHFTGFLNEQQMKEQYLLSNVFVCPSSIENSPNSLAEAQILGVPCVASYVGGIPTMVEHGVSGLLYRFEEVEFLAKYICDIFTYNDLCLKLQEGEIDAASKRHNRDQNALDMYNIYKMISSNG